MILWAIPPCGVLIAFSILFLIRNSMVYRLRTRLMNEESAWLEEHHQELADGRRQYGIYKRARCLPPYDVMLFKFWRSMASFERELGPVEQYYPLTEEG